MPPTIGRKRQLDDSFSGANPSPKRQARVSKSRAAVAKPARKTVHDDLDSSSKKSDVLQANKTFLASLGDDTSDTGTDIHDDTDNNLSAGTASSSRAPPPPPPIDDFAHPASVRRQQVVWIPCDPLGLGECEAKANAALGIEVSMEGAKMDGKGRVDVDRAPPGEDVA